MQSIYETVLYESHVATTVPAIWLFVSSCKSTNVCTAGVQHSTNEISLLDLLSGSRLIARNECESNTNDRVIKQIKRNEVNDWRQSESMRIERSKQNETRLIKTKRKLRRNEAK